MAHKLIFIGAKVKLQFKSLPKKLQKSQLPLHQPNNYSSVGRYSQIRVAMETLGKGEQEWPLFGFGWGTNTSDVPKTSYKY